MPSTESGESFAHGITDPDAAVAPRFHLGRLLRGQHGIGDVLIVAEHRVVEHPQSLAQEDR